MSIAERCGYSAGALRQRRCQSSTNRCRLSIELCYKYFNVSVYFIGSIGI